MQGTLFGGGGGGQGISQAPKDIQQGHQSNSHNVPSNLIQQMNQQNNSSPVVSQANHQQQRRANGNAQMQQNPDQIRQLIHSMSLGHLQQVNSSVPQPQPKISPIEADPIKSLIMQLSMQKNNNVPVSTMQPGVGHPLVKPIHPGSAADSVFPWGMLPGTGAQVNAAGMPHLMQQQNNNSQFHHPSMRNMPGFNLMENDLDLRKNEQQQQQQQWNTPNTVNPNNNKPSSLLSMWEMPPIKTPVINNGDIGSMHNFVESKTDQELEKQRQFLMEEQRQHMQQQQQQPVITGQQTHEKENNFHTNTESKHQLDEDALKFDEVKSERELKEAKEAKRQQVNKKEQEEAAKNKHNNNTNNNNNKKADTNNAKTVQQLQQSTKAKSAQKEADDKKRKAEDKKKSKELKELKERQQVEEKRKQEEMIEQQRKSKLLEAQRRETAMKIQEEQLALQQQVS